MIRVEVRYAYPTVHPVYGDTVATGGFTADCDQPPTPAEMIRYVATEFGRHNVTITSIKPVTCENKETT